MRSPVLWVALLGTLVGAPSASAQDASAQDASGLERARALFAQAELEAALREVTDALNEETLTLPRLGDALELQAVIFAALDRGGEFVRAATMLNSLAPDRPLSERISPDLRARFEAIQTVPLELLTSVHPGDTASTIEARVVGDARALVASTEIHVRVGDGPFSEVQASSTTVQATTARVEFYAEARSGSGTILVSAGSAQEPLLASAGSRESLLVLGPDPPSDDGDGSVGWVVLGVALGVAAVAAAAIIIGFVLIDSAAAETRFDNITIDGWPL